MANRTKRGPQTSQDLPLRLVRKEVRRVCEALEKQGLQPVEGMKIGSVRFLALKLPAPKQTVETLSLGNRKLEFVESSTTKDLATQLRTALRKAEQAMKDAGLISKPVQIGNRIFIPIVSRKTEPPSRSLRIEKKTPPRLAVGKRNPQSALPDLSDRVAMKLGDPEGNPLMTVPEVAWALGKSKSSIYRFVDEGKLSWSGVSGRINTLIVETLLQPH